MDDARVTVIIPTHDRLSSLRRAVRSALEQTHRPAEVFVIDDASTDPGYAGLDLGPDVEVVPLAVGSREAYGFPCAALARNAGLRRASGDFVAFLDDDDIWLPDKLGLQLAAMERTGCQLSCTEGYAGDGPFTPGAAYARYNAEHYWDTVQAIHRAQGSTWLRRGYPEIWSLEMLKLHNTVVTSSVVMERALASRIGEQRPLRGVEDYEYWLRALCHTNCVYVAEPCFYFDLRHAEGREG